MRIIHNSHFYKHISIDCNYIQTEQKEEQKADIQEFRNELEKLAKAEEIKKEADFQEYLVKQAEEKISFQERQTEESKKVQDIYNNIRYNTTRGRPKLFCNRFTICSPK